MKKLLLLLPLILIMGCAPKNDLADWQQLQLKANHEFQQRYEAYTANLTGQLNQQRQQIAQLNADKANLQNQLKQVQGQLSSAPTQQQITELRAQLATVNSALGDMTNKQAEAQKRVNALAASEYELTRQWNDTKLSLKALQSKLDSVTARTDITCTTNTTPATRKAFYEMWDIWVKTLED